jgi:hypothetical protein
VVIEDMSEDIQITQSAPQWPIASFFVLGSFYLWELCNI